MADVSEGSCNDRQGKRNRTCDQSFEKLEEKRPERVEAEGRIRLGRGEISFTV